MSKERLIEQLRHELSSMKDNAFKEALDAESELVNMKTLMQQSNNEKQELQVCN